MTGQEAVISPCGRYRYFLLRKNLNVAPTHQLVYAFFGVNPSTADARLDDATVRKWIGFVRTWGGSSFMVGNVFAWRATNVKDLAKAADPVGPGNADAIAAIIQNADALVPCWGDRGKVPKALHAQIDATMALLVASGKPVLHLGTTASGDPMHPLMLPYTTPLTLWPNL